MSTNTFVPTIWSKEIALGVKRALVAAQPGVVNHDYEGDVANQGDSVHINGLEPVTVKDYDRTAGLGAPERLTTNRTTLTIDQAKSFDFLVDDIEKVQTNPKYLASATDDSAYRIALVEDDFVLGVMVAGAGNATGANKITVTGAQGIDAAEDFYDKILIPLRTRLNKAECPTAARFVLVDADAEAKLLLDKRFVASGADAADDRLQNGVIGKAAGFTVILTNAPAIAGKAVAGVGNATTVADQIVKVRGMESENWFGTRVSGLRVYGAKVTRPANLAVATWANKS
ncbi:hypothetical protein [uncultured Friedmanniella sp.]|uniref:hypothetical protein n=1 Tax=uncultured Friedmanniella sp. TaxID=335381 RepID=UPI0035CA62D8